MVFLPLLERKHELDKTTHTDEKLQAQPDFAPERFGRLTTTGPKFSAPSGRQGKTACKQPCICDCGKTINVKPINLRKGVSKSCGCLRLELSTERLVQATTKHKKCGTPEYISWAGMLSRCRNPKNSYYQNYGGRGVAVCERWADFANFLEDMGEKPSASHSLDRIDADGNYDPENCRWATPQEQARNRRSNHLLTLDGKTQCVQAWADEYGIHQSRICNRLAAGWDIATAITQKPLQIGE